LRTFAALGVYGASAITAVTAQNTHGVTDVHYLPSDMVAAQIDTVLADFDVAAIKIGMLGSAGIVAAVAGRLGGLPSPQPSPASGRGDAPSASSAAAQPSHERGKPLLPLAGEGGRVSGRMRGRPFVVYDPVMAASSGDALSEEGFLDAVRTKLLPLVDCLTPNLAEAAALLGAAEARDEETMAAQGRALLPLGPRAVLMKGGHLEASEAVDWLVTREGTRRYAGAWIASTNTHGTGCTLSAAIAAHVARGAGLEDAVAEAKAFVARAIEAGRDVKLGGGRGPLMQSPLRIRGA
ncbi:MAG TPA: bifunctional hydroxymethylpyrimidine kinase/phosphomethylpyrimidine kinase, partial [Roseiarcus sp.]|nr:bifunctional hydroxymethylpyrimidine kinase/phosphomethylpyrimidine kinase [Roseiarcus sp.]